MDKIQSGLMLIVFMVLGACNGNGAAEEEPPDTTGSTSSFEVGSTNGTEHDASVVQEEVVNDELPQEVQSPTPFMEAANEEMPSIPSGEAYMDPDAGVRTDAGETDAAIVDTDSGQLTVETMLQKFPTYNVSTIAQKESGIKPIADCVVDEDMLTDCAGHGKIEDAPNGMLMVCLLKECYHQQAQDSCFASRLAPQGNSFGGMNECETTRSALAGLYVDAQVNSHRFYPGSGALTSEQEVTILSTYYGLTLGMFTEYQATFEERNIELQSLVSSN